MSAGAPWDKALKNFNISRDTLRRWLKKSREDGELRDAPRKPYKTRKIDPEKLEKIIEEQPDATLAELTENFIVFSIYFRTKSRTSLAERCLVNLGERR